MVTKTREEAEVVRLTADVVLFGLDRTNNNAMHVLLIKRGWDPFEGHWALPGGHVDAGEDVTFAAQRELVEETGVDLGPSVLELSGVYSAPGRDPRGRYVTFAHTYVLTHLVEPVAADDATEARWVRLTEVFNDMPLAFDHKQIIGEALPLAQRMLDAVTGKA
jgi:8-oxo-dGTP diphosphatase